MLQVRKLVLAVAAASALSTGVANALSLGDVSVKSYLGQPLEAEIELTDIKGLDSSEVKSQLASLEEFSRHGIERQFFLSNIKFTPVINHSGKSYIRVTSERAISEPYVSFLLELYWPSGRALREYTLLMDPPMYSPQSVVAEPAEVFEKIEETPAPASKPAPEAVAKQPAKPAAKPQVQEPRPQPAARQEPVRQPTLLTGDKHRVAKNESLWSIASRVEGEGSIYQKMVAIVDSNPHAFIGGDINKLRAGAQLTLPNQEQIRQTGKRDALNQYQEFQRSPVASATGSQLDARQLDRAAAAPAKVASEDNLRLISTETGESQLGSDRGSNSRTNEELSAQLAASKEQLDSVRMENSDLRERVEELDSQLARLQKLVELKNAQLANLQNMQLSDMEAADAAKLEAEAAQQEASVPVEESIDAVQEDSVAAVVETAEQEQAPAPAPAPAPAVEQEPAKPAPVKPVVVGFDEYEDKSFLDEMLENPLFLPAAGGAGLVALVMLLLVARKRKAAKESAELEAENEAYNAANPFEPEQEQDDDFADLSKDSVVLDELDLDSPSPATEVEDSFKQEQAKGGVLAEVEGYIAYGRFNEAASMLMQAIDSEPERADLRFKLLEVFADLDDRNGFARQISELEDMGGNQSELAAIKARYPDMAGDSFGFSGGDSVPDLGSLGLGLDDMGSTTTDDEDPLAGIDLSSFGTDEDITSAVAETSAEEDFNLDDLNDLGFSEPASSPEHEAEPVEELDELSLTLSELGGLDDLDTSAAEHEDEPLEFNLDDDLGSLSLGDDQVTETLDDAGLDFSADLDLAVADEPVAPVIQEETSVDLSDDFAALNEELDSLAETMAPVAASDDELGSLLDEAAELGTDFDLDAMELDEALPELEESLPVSELEDGLEDFDLDSLSDLGSLDSVAEAKPEVEAEADEAPSTLGDFAELEEFEGLPELEDIDGLDDIEDLSGAAPELASSELEDSIGDDFDFLAGTDETTTKLDLARAYIDMGDADGARDILDEIMAEGSAEQQQQAQELMQRLS